MKPLPHAFTITTRMDDKKIAQLIFFLFRDTSPNNGVHFAFANELHRSISKAIGRRFNRNDFPYQIERVEVENGVATLRFVKEADYMLKECLLEGAFGRA